MTIGPLIIAKPPTPYYQSERVTLYCGDCLEILPTLSGVDAVITSPPYNIDKPYGDRGDRRADYFDWLGSVFVEVRRVARGSFWLNVGYRTDDDGNVPLAFRLWPRVGMYLMQHVVWAYGAGMTYTNRFNHRHEDWLWFVADKDNYTFNGDSVRDIADTKYANDARNNPAGKLPGDVWYFPHVCGNYTERTDHPAQYPTAMIDRVVKAGTNDADTILDPFMGSGTTGVAAVRLGRKFIGIEISEEYCAIAKRRIIEAENAFALFDPPKPEQQAEMFAGVAK